MKTKKISKVDVEVNLNSYDFKSYEKYKKEAIRVNKEIMNEFKKNNSVDVVFRGKPFLSPTFIETAFVPILKEYDYEYIKDHLVLTNISPTAFENVKERLMFESENKNKVPKSEKMMNFEFSRQRNKKFNEIDWNTVIG